MSYAIGVFVYVTFVLLAVVLALFLDLTIGAPGDGMPLLQLLILVLPIFLVGPRVLQRLRDKDPLLPDGFLNSSSVLRTIGNLIVALGHVGFFGSLAVAVFFASTGVSGVPVGIFAGLSLFIYALGIVLLECGFIQWSKQQGDPIKASYKKQVQIALGVLIVANLAMNIGSNKGPVDLLPFHEREALARSLGFAREVQRAVERFYHNEERLPCRNDNYIDAKGLAGDEFVIDIQDCGRFSITVASVDGVQNKELLFVSSPTESSDREPLEWRCFSGHHTRIERHTRGKCLYDAAVAASH